MEPKTGVIGLIIVVVIIATYMGIQNSKIDKRLYRNNNDIKDKDFEKLIIPEDDVNEELKKLVNDGEYLDAVKKYRQATGTGLRESKEYIDYIRDK